MCYAISNEKSTAISNHCYYKINECRESTYVSVIRSNFTSFVDENDGSAAYIVNSGFQINGTYFVQCISFNGGGGAIYIKNKCDTELNTTILNCSFIKCRAVYGGGSFIYSSSNESLILIHNSVFINNSVTKYNPIDKKDIYFSGSALFLYTKSADVRDCHFNFNKGKGACKVVFKFDDNDKQSRKAMLLDENKKSMLVISGCVFDHEEKPISLMSLNNNENNLEVKECLFKGKLLEDTNNIKEKQEFNKNPMILIDSCSFDIDPNSAVIADTIDSNEPLIIDVDQLITTYFRLINSNWFKKIFAISSLALAIILVTSKIYKVRHVSNSLDDVFDYE